MKKSRTSQKYCKICKFRVRGKNHKEGRHHQEVLEELRKAESKLKGARHEEEVGRR